MEYTLRRSARARRIKIRVSPQLGVELVVPAGVSEAKATGFLQQRLDWIRRVQSGFEPRLESTMPDLIELPAFGLCYEVQRGGRRLLAGSRQIIVPEDWDFGECAEALREWLRLRARALLPAYCESLAAASDLGFERLRVGLQSSRWGSYSSRGTLSLNAKLLLMPEALLRYVVHHELTHSLHMNHSARFWNALARLEPEWRELRRGLRMIGSSLPAWARYLPRRGQQRRYPTCRYARPD